MRDTLFSDQLEGWLRGKQKKTISSLNQTFEERTHVVAIMLLLLPSALPIPTGGVTNVLELIAMTIALQLIFGRKSVWVPSRWQTTEIQGAAANKLIDWTIRITKRAESMRLIPIGFLVKYRPFLSVTGAILLILTVSSFFAPPFSGLDTLPSMGVVLICLAILLESGVAMIAGLTLGAIGVYLGLNAWEFLIEIFR